MSDAPPDDGDAHLRVVRGAADELELAALVAGLVAAGSAGTGGGHDHTVVVARSAWTDPAGGVRGTVPPQPGPDTWRWSQRG